MKNKIAAVVFMLAIPCSIVTYIKVSTAANSEILGVLAAVALYIIVFFLLSLFFNSREQGYGKAKSALDIILEPKKTEAEIARERILQKQAEFTKKK